MSEEQVDPSIPPSGTGCAECLSAEGWWVHLRRCTACGHVACCDTSPMQHATQHFRATGHRYIQSFEPGEDWWWDYLDQTFVESPITLAEPLSHPADQPTPGPAGYVPEDWRSQVH